MTPVFAGTKPVRTGSSIASAGDDRWLDEARPAAGPGSGDGGEAGRRFEVPEERDPVIDRS